MEISTNKAFIVEWSITAWSLFAVVLTAFNIHPLYVYAMIISSIGWLYLGVLWKKLSLVLIQIVVTIIYMVGLTMYYYPL